MPPRKPFLLRLPPQLLDELRRLAGDEMRSLNGQIEYLLRDALRRRGRPAGGDGDGDRGEDGGGGASGPDGSRGGGARGGSSRGKDTGKGKRRS